MTDNEPETANRWATEHYGFEDGATNQRAHAADAIAWSVSSALSVRSTSPRHDGRRSRRRTTLIASSVLSVALVAGIGGTAVASDDGPGGGRDGLIHVDHGGNHGRRGGIR
jgi:hypothetical protein